MKTNSWLYHYYMVQSRLQYGLAYGAPSPHSLPYYPHMLGAASQPQPFAAYDPGAGLGPAYLSSSHHNFSNPGVSGLYPSYLYPPPQHYLQPPGPPPAQDQLSSVRESKGEHHGPLDFSRGQADQYNSSQQSSPSLRSDSSSSPVYHPPHDSLYGSPEVAVLSQGGRHHSISDHHYKTNQRTEAHHHHARLRDQAATAPHLPHPHISFWSDTQLSGFEKYKPDLDSQESGDRKRVKKEADFYSSDSNNNSDGPPTYYSLDQLHLQQH